MWPILLRLGSITVFSFGVAMAVSALCGSFLVWRQTRKQGLSEERVLDVLFLTILLSLLFGRVGYIYFHWATFSPDWSRILLVGKYPGLSFISSLTAGIIFSGLLAKNSGLPALLIWDIFSLAMSFALVTGLSGCFLDNCIIGMPIYTSLILALLALVWWGGLMFMSKIMTESAGLAEVSKRHGFFFLGYLIFQTFSLLMLTPGINVGNMVADAYLFILATLVLIFAVRYRKLFSFIYDSVSKKRFGPNHQIS